MCGSAPLSIWEDRFRAFLERCQSQGSSPDSSHGIAHVQRVVGAARMIGTREQARMEVVLPAAWLHDCVLVEKDSEDRSRASALAADAARIFLVESGYPPNCLGEIHHAIHAHSFSAGIPPRTLEAQVVQDADRLDALGAIGLARCLMVGERLGRPLLDPSDPFCRERDADDTRSTLDHFYTKLLRLPETMQTSSGKAEAERRAEFLRSFLVQLESELDPRQIVPATGTLGES